MAGGGVAMLAGEEGKQHYYQIADMLATKSKKEQLKYWRKADPKGNIKPIFDAVLAKRPSKQSAKEQVPVAGDGGPRGGQATSAMVMGAQGQAKAVELLEGEAGEQHYYKIADMLLLKSKKEQAQYWKTCDHHLIYHFYRYGHPPLPPLPPTPPPRFLQPHATGRTRTAA